MELNDVTKISIVKTVSLPEVEVLYWKLEDALYKNDRSSATMFFDMFLYMGQWRKDLITDGLKSCYRKRLQSIAYEINGESTTKEIKPIEIKFAISPKPIPFNSEKQLNDYLCLHPEVLSAVLGQKISIRGSEVEIGDYKCDIVAEGNSLFFPIELKIRQSNHAVVSQIQKYCFYFYRELRYDKYKKIQGVTISNGMDEWSINELRRNNIWIFDIIPDGNDISLRLVD